MTLEEQTRRAAWAIIGISIVFILIGLIGCATQTVYVTSVDQELAPYFKLYALVTGVDTNNISAKFAPLKLPVVGECATSSNGSRSVNIDPEYWTEADKDHRELLMMHELGHCTSHLEHLDGFDTQGCPLSIMHSEIYGGARGRCFASHKTYYFQELRSLIAQTSVDKIDSSGDN